MHHRLATLTSGLATVVGILLAAFGPASRAAAPPPRPPNVVLILTDDLGINDLGCYGRRDHPTPHLDRLAAEGTRFTSAYCAQPICSPSRAALLTGLTPARLHLTTYLPGRRDAPSQRLLHPPIRQQLPLEIETLPERLRPAGYVSACLGKWHLGGPGFGPAEQGFDVVHPGRANTTPSATEGGKGEYDLTERAIAFMEANRTRPFLLYLAHHTPHIPYTARTELIEARAGAFEPTYAAVISSLDDTVGTLLSHLDRLGLRDQTLVAFTSDNGGLHVPELSHARITHNTPFRAGKGFLYEGGLRVPLIVRWPGHIPGGRVVDDPVINTDWVPTLLEFAGQPAPDGLDGRSLARLLTDRDPAPQRPFHWHFPHYNNQGGRPGGAVREGRWKLIAFDDTDQSELYDLARDPSETVNLAADHPRRVQRLRRSLAAWRREVGAQTNAPNPAADETRFRALYVDFDPSRFDARRATDEDWQRVAEWRRQMDAAVSTTPIPR